MNAAHWWRPGGEGWRCRVCGEIPRHPGHWGGDDPESRAPGLGNRWVKWLEDTVAQLVPFVLLGSVAGGLAAIPLVLVLL